MTWEITSKLSYQLWILLHLVQPLMTNVVHQDRICSVIPHSVIGESVFLGCKRNTQATYVITKAGTFGAREA